MPNTEKGGLGFLPPSPGMHFVRVEKKWDIAENNKGTETKMSGPLKSFLSVLLLTFDGLLGRGGGTYFCISRKPIGFAV